MLPTIGGIDHGVEEVLHLVGVYAQQRLPLGDDLLLDHRHCHTDSRSSSALRSEALQEEQHSVLDGELDLLVKWMGGWVDGWIDIDDKMYV